MKTTLMIIIILLLAVLLVGPSFSHKEVNYDAYAVSNGDTLNRKPRFGFIRISVCISLVFT